MSVEYDPLRGNAVLYESRIVARCIGDDCFGDANGPNVVCRPSFRQCEFSRSVSFTLTKVVAPSVSPAKDPLTTEVVGFLLDSQLGHQSRYNGH